MDDGAGSEVVVLGGLVVGHGLAAEDEALLGRGDALLEERGEKKKRRRRRRKEKGGAHKKRNGTLHATERAGLRNL